MIANGKSGNATGRRKKVFGFRSSPLLGDLRDFLNLIPFSCVILLKISVCANATSKKKIPQV
jgi:hypothetical protein